MPAKLLCLAALVLWLPAGAFAQDASPATRPRAPSLLSDQTFCSEVLEVECGPARHSSPAPQPQRGFLTRFSRLAGMFMGRVDAAHTGDFRLRITLQLKTPPSSINNHISFDD